MVEERHYLISDAAKLVAVEAHVLRYWEEELNLPIARTELGHRYYTRENIKIFQNVKKLKEEGLQLKAIKVLLQQTLNSRIEEEPEPEIVQETALIPIPYQEEKRKLFQELVGEIVEKIVKDNNEELQKRIEMTMAKETDYLLHRQEQREEERFRRLDEAIRLHQKNSRYVAASKEKHLFFRWFGR